MARITWWTTGRVSHAIEGEDGKAVCGQQLNINHPNCRRTNLKLCRCRVCMKILEKNNR